MIKIAVDRDKCQNYAQCVLEAPDVFRLNDDEKLEYTGDAEDDRLADLESAADVCPMQAILITRA